MRLVGGNEAGDVAQDAAATLDDGKRVGVAAMCQRSHQKRQSAIYSADIRLVLSTVSRQVPERTQYRLQCRLLKDKEKKSTQDIKENTQYRLQSSIKHNNNNR